MAEFGVPEGKLFSRMQVAFEQLKICLGPDVLAKEQLIICPTIDNPAILNQELGPDIVH